MTLACSLNTDAARDFPQLRLVVLGIGNTLLGDDAAGIHVVRHLETKQRASLLPQGRIELVDGGTLGYLLIDRIADADGLVVVDSANLKDAPGSVRVFSGGEVEDFLAQNSSSSVHEAGLIDLLQMLSLNDESPARCALVGIQPETIDWGTELSTAVGAAIPDAGRAVEKVLRSWLENREAANVETR